ncbi:MAG TPA: ornithine carbamoyltransferase, partial [Terriglobia bacterium]|nr:ornithine carbamoyltransferase [Terriglobia bacterium]
NQVFAAYRVTKDMMAAADPGAVFMHCLPAHRGQEVTDEVIDSHQSVVYDQAENRLHTQKALMILLMQDAHH